jgi:hypothetical protein
MIVLPSAIALSFGLKLATANLRRRLVPRRSAVPPLACALLPLDLARCYRG